MKIAKSRIFLPPTLQKERAPAEPRKINENREKPKFFYPHSSKKEGVHERAEPREPRQGRSGGASEWTPLRDNNAPAGARQGSTRAGEHPILANHCNPHRGLTGVKGG